MMNDDNYVEIRNLNFSRDGRKIYNNLSMDIPKNKITVVMGPSGSGKTTLLRLIGKQLEPDSGGITVNDVSLNQVSRKELFLLRSKMGVLFQSASLFHDLNVSENVAFPLRVHTNLSDQMISDLVSMKLEAVGLRGAKNLVPSELSGGMARRVALARAIILDPSLLMYDEPFVGQDPIILGILKSLIQKINLVKKTTSLIVSHNIVEALSIADMIYIISNGEIVAQGSADDIKNSKSKFVLQFINGYTDGPVAFNFPAEQDYTAELLGNTNA
jgi:phospholipid/cholesterol/gamma-HCH transport system ATP-binding protein